MQGPSIVGAWRAALKAVLALHPRLIGCQRLLHCTAAMHARVESYAAVLV